ncbi:MBL fold metallo-hydrolase [Enterovibrio sp. 27052020O]|uniref:MBL fold metallo-hydrolase n=1 Tax=Enterovibrio sp. 27052020O TaxID=3241166 RepID=UPI00388E87B2
MMCRNGESMLTCVNQGEVASDLYLVGNDDVPVYLMKVGQQSWALVEGGITRHSDEVWLGVTEIVDPADIHWWLITHSHFDHCGVLAALYARLPNVKVVASRATAEHWQSESANAVIRRLNQELHAQSIDVTKLSEIPIEVVNSPDRIVLGTQCRMDIIATPGHAPDQIAYYDPDKKRLFCGDALGELHVESMNWRPLMFDDVGEYLSSVSRLSCLDVEQLIPGHGGVVMGSEVRTFIESSNLAANLLITRYRRLVANEGDPDALASALTNDWAPNSATYISSFLHTRSMKVMFSAIQRYLKVKQYEEPVGHHYG